MLQTLLLSAIINKKKNKTPKILPDSRYNKSIKKQKQSSNRIKNK